MEWAGAVQLPIDSRSGRRARKTLTIACFNRATDVHYDFCAFHENEESLFVPRVYAEKTGLEVAYESGHNLPVGALHPVELRDIQVPWVNEIMDLFAQGVNDIRAEAFTGFGKTTSALEVARRLGKRVLILVDQEFIRDQWAQRAIEQFGAIPDDIGYIQGDKYEYNKPIVIAMVQTLYRKEDTKKMAESIGMVIFDESHTVGAPMYSRVLSMLPARYRLAVSATPERGDEMDKLLEWHLGPVQVVAAASHKPSIVRVVEYDGCYSWYANTSPKIGKFLNEVAADGNRNRLLATIIHTMWHKGRKILAVSDRTEQLETIMSLCAMLGVPKEDMGLVCGKRSVWKLAKDDKPMRKPLGYVAGTLYTPVKMQLLQKRISRKDQDAAKNNSNIIFATYGMFRKGVDVPRLDTGVDCTPSSKATQVHGRILRSKVRGKKVPIWVTLREKNSQRAEYQLGQRLIDYQKSNAEVYLWRLDKGVRRLDAQELKNQIRRNHQRLKTAKVLTKRDGNYTIAMRE
jgi:superfamily II DNA or RNA helicase